MIQDVQKAIAPYQEKLLGHPLYQQIQHPAHLRTFMEHHVFAVWDFMSLLKALQNTLTCTRLPWVPVGDAEVRYLINEIVLAEETDVNLDGKRQSHFEMYLEAMETANASTETINSFLNALKLGNTIESVIVQSNIPDTVKSFLRYTFQVIDEGKPHCIAAAFTFGREDLIPSMFTQIIKHIQQHFPEQDLTQFKYYFDRHIELDEDEHGPMALKMVEMLCENDRIKWQEVKSTSIEALQKRIELWNGIEASLEINGKVVMI